MTRSRFSPRRLTVGLIAISTIAATGFLLPGWGRLRVPAEVQAARTFTLASIEPGRYHWSLRDGSAARGRSLVREKILRFEQTELVELELAPGLTSGDQVLATQTLAVLQSLRAMRRADELRAARQEFLARRALLAAGSRAEEVEEARVRVEVARAELARQEVELNRVEILASKGLTSAQELETSQQLVEIRRRQVALALAGEAVKRSSAREEAISEVEAELAAVDAGVEEVAALIDEGMVRSPVAGVVQLGGVGSELQVFDLSAAYLKMPIGDRYRSQVHPGTEIVFRTPAAPGSGLNAEIVEIAVEAETTSSGTMWWASALVEDPEHLLLPGTTGVATLLVEGAGSNPLVGFWRYVTGAQP